MTHDERFQTIIPFHAAAFQRLKIGLVILTFLVLSCSDISNVHAKASHPSPQEAQRPAQASELDTLIQATYLLYQDGKFDEALANCTKAKTLSPNDFRAYALAGFVWMAQWKMKSASTEFANAIRHAV